MQVLIPLPLGVHVPAPTPPPAPPGNLLLLPDGRLGLIDFGMTKELSTKERRLLARSLVAVHDGDEAEMLEVCHEAQLKSKHMRREMVKVAVLTRPYLASTGSSVCI